MARRNPPEETIKLCPVPEALIHVSMDVPLSSLFSYTPAHGAPRMQLKDQVPYKPETLAKRAAKFLTLSAEYADGANDRFWAMVNNTKQRLPNMQTRREPCLPFESGDNTLPGMEKYK